MKFVAVMMLFVVFAMIPGSFTVNDQQRCPRDVVISRSQLRECFSNADCKGSEICCFYGCLSRCLEPTW